MYNFKLLTVVRYGDRPSVSASGFFIFLLTIHFFWGCTATTPQPSPPLQIPDAFSSEGGQPMADDWWTSFNDPALDLLIDSAMSVLPFLLKVSPVAE